MKTPLVSIITPCYNSERYIAKAIESVINQTFIDWELIIIDDKSTDNSLSIIKEFLKIEPKIKLIEQDINIGAANARNIGIKNAIGEYISFLDSDDIWLPEKLEKQIKYMRDNNILLTYCSYYTIDENDNIKNIRRAKDKVDFNDILKSNFIGNSTAIYNAKILGKRYFENIHHEDYLYWIRIIKDIQYAKGIDLPLAKYRVRNSSISSNKIKSAIWTLKIYRNVLKLDILQTIYSFINYIYYGFKKRI